MRILILSDLHLEFGEFDIPASCADIAVFAGDVHRGVRGITWLRSHFPKIPVIYVPGNHEYYRNAMGTLLNKLNNAATGSNIRVLDNESFIIGKVRFLGATLWSNFEITGTNPAFAGTASEQVMNDFRLIRVAPSYRRFRSKDAYLLHRKTMHWLRSEVAESTLQTVIITHHAPSATSLPNDFRSNIVSSAYATNLDEFIKHSNINLWVHGHIHTSQDYTIGQTRIICNPRGYPDDRNPSFNPTLLVEL